MKLPRSHDDLRKFSRETIEQCSISRDKRRERSKWFQNLFFTGSASGGQAKLNKCFSHLNKLASYLFSASETRFSVEFAAAVQPQWEDKAESAADAVNEAYRTARVGSYMSLAVLMALIDGCCFVKQTWNMRRWRVEPHLVRGYFMGVLREDVSELDRQEAFTHSFYLTKPEFARLIENHPDRKGILETVKGLFEPANDDVRVDGYFREMIAGMGPGGGAVIGSEGVATGAQGQVQMFAAPPMPELSIDTASELIRVDDLWVWNDDLNDWTTLRCVNPDIIVEGRYRHRNLSDAPRRIPFTKVCGNEWINYFWGVPELATLIATQEQLNERINDVDRIFRLQARTPKAFSGFTGITEEKALALLIAGGTATSEDPNAKVQSLAPEMPQGFIEYLREISAWFDESAGFTPILNGQGEAGVRTNQQANTLLRTASPRLRDRALFVEEQVTDSGNIMLAIHRAKNPIVISTIKNDQFFLEQLPDDASTRVDSHSSSPAFSTDMTNTGFALMKGGAIDGEDLLEIVQPPNTRKLVRKYRKREEARAKFIQEHPEILSKSKPGPKPALSVAK